MLLYECFYIAVGGPLIQYLKTFKIFSSGAELIMSQSHNELSTNVRVKVEGAAVALSSLWPRYHALVFKVELSQWLAFIISSGGAHSFWPCSVNILELLGAPAGVLELHV